MTQTRLLSWWTPSRLLREIRTTERQATGETRPLLLLLRAVGGAFGNSIVIFQIRLFLE
jgi:hypothetical protein